LRLGCDAFASDLNPVACFILKVMLEDIPRHARLRAARGQGPELAEELRKVGAEIKKQAEKELAQFYPPDPDLPAPRRGAFFVYVLKCADDSFYIGQTDDIPRRLAEHEAGEASWTAPRRPVQIIHWETCASREEAVKREQELKTGFGRKWLKREYDAGRLAARQAGGAVPIAYLWARTVRCESPNCGAEIPLMRSFWLCKKSSRLRALRAKVLKPKDKTPQIEFEVFTPKSEKEVPVGTVTRAKATCLACERVLAPDRVRAQLREQRGGADAIFDAIGNRIGGARLLAVVTSKDNAAGRQYRVATDRDYEAVWKARKAVEKLANEKLPNGLSVIPNELLPEQNTLGLRVPNYGVKTWADLFSSRQELSLHTLATGVNRLATRRDNGDTVGPLLALAVSRTADYCSANCSLHAGRDVVRNTWARNALPVVWDFYESVPWTDSSGAFGGAVDWVARVAETLTVSGIPSGQVQVADACDSPLPHDSTDVWFTDPPYYNAIGYAESSDFFFVWLKRILPTHTLLRDPFDPENPLTPKNRECIQDDTFQSIEGVRKDRSFFENQMARAFVEGRNVLRGDGAGCVVFAHKTTEGWEALLGGLLRAGWIITASWPIETEMKNKMSGSQSGESKAMLLASVHLICRPRPEDAPIGDWADVLRELPDRIGDWMERLSAEGVRGADLVFACIGPAMEVYSRYSRVEDAEGREIPLGGDPEATEPHNRGFLAYVWEIVGRTALGQVLGTAEARARNGAAGALEEDARLTALFLWTLQATRPVHNAMISYSGTMTHGGSPTADVGVKEESENNGDDENEKGASSSKQGLTLIYDVVRRFSQPLGIHLENWDDRIISTEKGIVRLLPVTERAEHLLGEDGATGVADVIERTRGGPINYQFAFAEDAAKKTAPATEGKIRKRRTAKSSDEAPTMQPGTTTLDRVHIAMLLQSAGKSNALRTMLKAETDRGPDFLRLANALSALYPKDSEEKRLLDAMLLAVPR
jgi:adenine-specific DNA methylase